MTIGLRDARSTEPQRRALTVGLEHIETELGWIETVLDLKRVCWPRSRMISRTRPAGRFESASRRAREMIREIGGTFGLTPEVTSKSRWIRSHLPRLRVVAEEPQRRHLSNHGDVTPKLATLLDPAARRLGELTLSIQRAVEHGPICHEDTKAQDQPL